MSDKDPSDLACVADVAEASTLLHPLRLRILDRARTPRSAADIAAELGLPRQKVNYHVRELHRARLLRKAGRHRKRNLYEQRYVATARSYLLSPDLLGPLRGDPRDVQDRFSAAYLLATGGRLVAEVERATRGAAEQGKKLATLTIDAALRFENAKQRTAFTGALHEAVARVIAEHASPYTRDDGKRGRGRPYRLVVGCHPIPADADGEQTETPKSRP